MHLEFERSIWTICEQEKHSLGVETDYYFFFFSRSLTLSHCSQRFIQAGKQVSTKDLCALTREGLFRSALF